MNFQSLKVSNVCSPSSGREIANQFEIRVANGYVFQSYDSLIAIKTNGQRVIHKDYYKYSSTTTKYTSVFFGCDNAKELHQEVKDGYIKLVDDTKFEKLLRQAQS